MKHSVSILMLTCNNVAKAQKCLASWLPVIKDDYIREWLVLDNASSDGTATWLRSFAAHSAKIRVIYSRQNLGCAGGRAVLFKQAQGDLLLSLDSDVQLFNRQAVRTLAAELDNPRIGIVGDHGGGVRADWTWTSEAPAGYEGEIPVISGYCQMFRRSALQHAALDMFYNPYWLEDSDFCFQLREKLGQVGFVRRCGVRHVWSGTNNGGTLAQQHKWEYFRQKWQDKLGDSVIYTPPPKPSRVLARKIRPATPNRTQKRFNGRKK